MHDGCISLPRAIRTHHAPVFILDIGLAPLINYVHISAMHTETETHTPCIYGLIEAQAYYGITRIILNEAAWL